MSEPIFIKQGLSTQPSAIPIFMRWHNRFYFIAGVSILTGSFYFISNQIHINPPRLLSLGWVDQKVPFLPWTIWIYVSGLVYLAYALVINRCLISLSKHLYSYFFIVFFSSLGFLFFPIQYPRELFPLPMTLDPLTYTLFAWIRTIDSPANCTPSLHVSVSFLIALGFLDDRRRHFPLVVTWASLLAISTLTTKQHYFVDVILGLLQATLFFFLFHRVFRYRLIQSSA
jgi:membrane-associated phospholipid phosphatase